MRAAGLVVLTLLGGVAAVGAWWWMAGREDEATRLATASVAKRFADARTEAEGAPAATPVAIEAQRTRTADAPAESDSQVALPPALAQLRPIRMHVVDRDTRAELRDVTVIRGNSPTPMLEHAASPVTVAPGGPLNPVTHRQNFAFIAPGYVRGSASIDFLDTTDRTVELRACGVLLVTILGELPKSTPPPRKGVRSLDLDAEGKSRVRDADLRLKHEESFSGMFRNFPLALGETRIDEVVPGNMTVSVAIGGAPAIVLASKFVRVAAGETVRVDLELAPFAMPEAAPLAGTLRVPPGWPDEKLGLSISPRGIPGATPYDGMELAGEDLTPVPGRSGTYRWEAGDVLPGTYAITIKGTETTKQVEVPPTGATDVSLEAATHAKLRVRVVSSTDGSPVKLSWLDWAPEPRDGFAAVSPILLLHDEATRTFRSSVPIGRGVLESYGADLWMLDDPAPAEIFPGEQELVARVRPVGGASLVLTSEGKSIEIERRLVEAITVAPLGGSGRCLWKSHVKSQPAFAADPPGRYRVTLPAIAGYDPVAPFDVDVVVGELVKVPVELRRAR